LLDLSVLIEHFAVATAALSAGRREGGYMAELAGKHNYQADFSAESAVYQGCGLAWPARNPISGAGVALFPRVVSRSRTAGQHALWHAQEAAMWENKSESWQTYTCFAVVGAIFIVCQVLSAACQAGRRDLGRPGRPHLPRGRALETAGQGGRIFAGDPLRPARFRTASRPIERSAELQVGSSLRAIRRGVGPKNRPNLRAGAHCAAFK
jgi:hypothetical protein